uniref:Uncharacterized protein n=1 Tax=Caenorhabditis japonica TaxID=281687 RepID=A0A8R1EAS9_CAEJA
MNDPDRDELIFGDPGDKIDFSESDAEKILAFDPDTLNDDEAMDTDLFENGPAADQEAVEMTQQPHSTQVDVTDLPAEAIVRMRELPAHMIKSEVHPFASSDVEPIEKMDPPDSATKRMAFYCTLDMIQAGRNKSITDARPINEARPTLKPIRRENLQTIDFWPNHADGALPYVLRNRDGRRWWAFPLFAETVAADRPDLHMVILDVFADDLGNGDRVDVNDYLFGDIILITSFMALPNSRLADTVSTFDNIHRTESHRFLAVKELYLLKREFSETQDDYATILQLTNGHLTSDPAPPSVVTIKHLRRRDAEDFDAMPQPFRRFNGDKGRALAALVECAFMGFTGSLAAANKNRDVRAYATTITNCT